MRLEIFGISPTSSRLGEKDGFLESSRHDALLHLSNSMPEDLLGKISNVHFSMSLINNTDIAPFPADIQLITEQLPKSVTFIMPFQHLSQDRTAITSSLAANCLPR